MIRDFPEPVKKRAGYQLKKSSIIREQAVKSIYSYWLDFEDLQGMAEAEAQLSRAVAWANMEMAQKPTGILVVGPTVKVTLVFPSPYIAQTKRDHS